MPFHRQLSLLEKTRRQSLSFESLLLTFTKRIRLGQKQPKQDKEHGRASTKPVQGPPPMWSRINQRPCKSRSQQISERIPLLKQTGNHTAGFIWAILQSRRRGISIHTAHGDSEKGPTCQELLVRVAEPRAQFQRDEEQIVDDKRPLSTPSIARYSEDDCAD